MDKIIFFSFSILIYILVIKAETSSSHFERQKFMLAYLVTVICGIITGFIFINGRVDREVFMLSFIAFGFLPSFLISRALNFIKHKDKLYFFTLSKSSKAFNFINAILWLFFIGFKIFAPKEVPPNHFGNFSNYYIYSYGNYLLAIVMIYYSLSNAFQIIKIYEEGLYFEGFLWKWSDFDSYSITTDIKNENFQTVTLNLQKKIWVPIDNIFLSIIADNGEKLNSWLSQRLPRA